MLVFRSPAEVPDGFGPSVVAVGKFDGVHAGHRAVLDRARADAAGTAKVVAVTFDRNPLAVLRPDACPPSLTGVPQKLELLAETGIDAVLVLTFDRDLADLEPERFVDAVLGPLGMRTILVGGDFRFGRGGVGTPQLLAELGAARGFTVDVIDDVRARAGERRVSSTWVREALADGDIATATRLLGRAPSVWGEVVHGLKRGRELGFPTANLGGRTAGVAPADGVYAGWLLVRKPGGDHRYPAAISVGTNPTFDDVDQRQVEAYVLDEHDLDLYGASVEVQFTARIRGMVAFDGIDALIERMTADVAEVRAILA